MKRSRVVAALLVGFGGVVIACSSDDPKGNNNTPPTPVADSNDAGASDLANAVYNPTFEPDFNNLVPQDAAKPVTQAQSDAVTVTPTQLEFAAADGTDAKTWEVGRIVVSAPGNGGGSNPLGFARRVKSVKEENGKVIVVTETVGLEDLASGDFQVKFDPKIWKDVDVSKLDREWAAQNLYYKNPRVFLPGEPLIDNSPGARSMVIVPGQPWFWDDIASAATDVANAVKNAVNTVIDSIPKDFTASIGVGNGFNASGSYTLFSNLNFEKEINPNGKLPMKFKFEGNSDVYTSVGFTPGFQVGARIPNYLASNPPSFQTWINVDSKLDAYLKFHMDLKATLESAGGKAGSALEEELNGKAEQAEQFISQQREQLFGNPDLKPAGGWKTTLWISKPSTTTFFAGPVPVVLTSTVQVDLECGFQAKATLKTDIESETISTFKFKALYDSAEGARTDTAPTFNTWKSSSVKVTGGGELEIACGLIPRVNTFLYDTVGLNVGVRASAVARASYESTCTSPTSTQPTGEVDVSLAANFGLQLGARFQAPGSSFAGKNGQAAGFDVGPIEPWNTEVQLGGWQFGAPGLGYCTPSCKNGKLDGSESGLDCGGPCDKCNTGGGCKVNTDCRQPGTCNKGSCQVDPCNDLVRSPGETDIDCGGKCSTKCAIGGGCLAGGDCASGVCNQKLGVCVKTLCFDGVRDGDEGGVDCGGTCAAKCAAGAQGMKDVDCASGISDGTFCITDRCKDKKSDNHETGIDCGSTAASGCPACSLGQLCNYNSDCLAGSHCEHDFCVRDPIVNCTDKQRQFDEGDVDCGAYCPNKCKPAQTCLIANDCDTGVCTDGHCQTATCSDKKQNGTETDVDCGGSCVAGDFFTCAAGKGCGIDADCATGSCDATKHCAQATACTDKIKDGNESDVDCGGTCATKCTVGKSCFMNADCLSGSCNATTFTCNTAGGYVFVTSTNFNSMFGTVNGGLAAADAACQATADTNGGAVFAGRTWKAFLSDSGISARDRMNLRGGYRLKNDSFVATSADAFFSFVHLVNIDIDETGTQVVGSQRVWTGFSPAMSTGDWCNNWTKPFGTAAVIGVTDAHDSSWTSSPLTGDCDNQFRLYCVEQ